MKATSYQDIKENTSNFVVRRNTLFYVGLWLVGFLLQKTTTPWGGCDNAVPTTCQSYPKYYECGEDEVEAFIRQAVIQQATTQGLVIKPSPTNLKKVRISWKQCTLRLSAPKRQFLWPSVDSAD